MTPIPQRPSFTTIFGRTGRTSDAPPARRNFPGVRFVRSYVSIGREIPETKNVTIRYATDAEGVQEEEFDLVVLGVGLAPPTKVNRLAEQFGIELNAHGFCKTNPVNPH